jgi:coenzyme F420-0:L-glutamate ligase/coenzyme F420-1:gamma-L-glutamate ligase
MASDGFTVFPIKSPKMSRRFHLGNAVLQAIRKNGQELSYGDIVVVSSKFAAMAEGRYVNLRKIRASKEAKSLAAKYELDPSLAELIKRESEVVLGGIPGFALAVSKGILAPNAGIDRSNIRSGYAILYPKNPRKTAFELRGYLLKFMRKGSAKQKNLGVILSDSRITPTRLGTIGIAIASSGLKPVIDFRGKEDLFGNKLKVTLKAVGDQLCSVAQLVMGEASESVPIVIIRGYKADFDETGSLSMTIPFDKCLYIQGLKSQ